MNTNCYENQKIRGLKRKYEAIMSRGGRCELCGYNKNLAALEFHHKNPSEKEFQIDVRHFSNTKLEILKEELDKCLLVCSNCHREIHHPDLTLDNIQNTILTIKKESFSNPSGQVCPVCGKRFRKTKGKIYCSKECREKDKHYPTIDEINEQYKLSNSWEKVAQHFGLTRKIIQGIRKRNS